MVSIKQLEDFIKKMYGPPDLKSVFYLTTLCVGGITSLIGPKSM